MEDRVESMDPRFRASDSAIRPIVFSQSRESPKTPKPQLNEIYLTPKRLNFENMQLIYIIFNSFIHKMADRCDK